MITVMKSRKAGLSLLAAVGLAIAGCRHHALGTPAGPAAVKEEPCWWTVFRTPLPLDTVTAHLVGAFTTLGLAGASSSQQGDTTWAQAGPTRLDDWRGAIVRREARDRLAEPNRARGRIDPDSTAIRRHRVVFRRPTAGWRLDRDEIAVER